MSEEKNSSMVLNVLLSIIIVLILVFFYWYNLNENNKVLESPVSVNDTGVTGSNSEVATNIDYVVQEDDNIRGNLDAKVTVVEFSDFQCPYCSSFHETMNKVVENYPDKVKWVYKHFPLTGIHPYSNKAAQASECAGEQDKFWEYADGLFENQSLINDEYLTTNAENLGLDIEQFGQCLDSRKYEEDVNNDYNLGLSYGVNGTPGNIINGKMYPGALPYEQMVQIINELY